MRQLPILQLEKINGNKSGQLEWVHKNICLLSLISLLIDPYFLILFSKKSIYYDFIDYNLLNKKMKEGEPQTN